MCRSSRKLRQLLPEICHKRGALAIGGMTALYPSRQDPELERARVGRSAERQKERSRLADGRRLDRASDQKPDCDRTNFQRQINCTSSRFPRTLSGSSPDSCWRWEANAWKERELRFARNSLWQWRTERKRRESTRRNMEDLATDRIIA